MKNLKYQAELAPLIQVPFFKTVDAKKCGVPRYALAYMVKQGLLERICPGTFRFASYESKVAFEWENIACAAASIPDSTICLISALCYYDLTEEIMREAWIAIPHPSHPPRRPLTRIVRMRNTTLGRKRIVLGEYRVHIFDRERCIVDAFRYLSKETAIKAMQRYFRNTGYKPQPKKLGKYAKILHVNITPYILACTT